MKAARRAVTISPSFSGTHTLYMSDINQKQGKVETCWVQLLAGTDSQGMPVLEKLEVKRHEQEGTYELLHSPLFVRDLAAGDVFNCEDDNPASYTVIKRSGKLAVRVFCKDNPEELEAKLTPEVEKLDGSLDLKTDRALVYSVHVNIGFGEIERLFDNAIADTQGPIWYYGNIYDRDDGVTPLNWWDEFINQV
ncbi:MAG: DUF4265 domain-containing protein [Gammaproteobacteria bacterium]|nr:DUF4265 domain-containing protein [Gammaproteobacteria bacterium]